MFVRSLSEGISLMLIYNNEDVGRTFVSRKVNVSEILALHFVMLLAFSLEAMLRI